MFQQLCGVPLAFLNPGGGKLDYVGIARPVAQDRSRALVGDVSYLAAQGHQGVAYGKGAGRAVGFRPAGHEDIEAGHYQGTARVVDDILCRPLAEIGGHVGPEGQHPALVEVEDYVFYQFGQETPSSL